jgi:hypothetical protein
MTEWFYKATPTKVSFEETRDLAVNDGFICRYRVRGEPIACRQHAACRVSRLCPSRDRRLS